MDNLDKKDLRYRQAAGRIREIKGFYIHLAIYAAVNLIILFKYLAQKPGGEEQEPYNFFTGVLWGIVILIHAVSIFLPGIRRWEREKTELFLSEYLKSIPQTQPVPVREKNEISYLKAKKRVKKIKDFYVHAFFYVAANVMLIASNVSKGKHIADIDNYWVALFWGIGLLSHWASAFVPDFLLGSRWEERKIREYMDKYH